MLSNLRRVVLTQLYKAWRLGLDVPAGRLVTVFKLNGSLTYRFLKELESEGVAERTGRGRWRLRDTSRARALAEYAYSLWLEEAERRLVKYQYLAESAPDVYYYVPDLPTPWFGGVAYVLVVADPALRGKLNPPASYRFVYVSLRGRRVFFSWNLMVPVGTREQSLADYLSYDPEWDAELYTLWYLGDVDLDEVAKRCTLYGLKRLSTFLSFLRVATGKPIATRFDYLRLLDEEVYRERLPSYFTWVFANGVAERRNI